MSEKLTHTGRSLASFSNELRNVPQALAAVETAIYEPRAAVHVLTDYLRIVRSFANLTDADRGIFRSASEKLTAVRGGKNNESGYSSTVEQYEALLGDETKDIVSLLLYAFDTSNPDHTNAISDLARMMYQGNELFRQGRTPRDGDPDFDAAIWSHTQISDTKLNIHVVIVHFMERFMSNMVEERCGKKPQKDSFIGVLVNFVILEGIRNPKLKYIFDLWQKPKSEGGLGWIKPDRVSAIKEALRESS